ncbi:MAG: cysteine desulfurase [Oscillospiraceae bacterium]|jgi:cysteine desulfurase|nr:cysteine desulfurase [Oscillospiraceae bacterium]
MTVYFDNAATTKPRPEAVAAATRAMTELYGNPSSTHEIGRAAAFELTRAREHVAAALGGKPENIIFTSGGTESDNLALFSAAQLGARHGKHIVTSLTEHSAVLNTAERLAKLGYEVTFLKPARSGIIPPADLTAALREDTILVSLMLVNNETGALSPAFEYARAIRAKSPNALYHVDAVQAFGKMPFTAKSLDADLISVSAHKIHGIKGAGALFTRSGVALPPQLYGGQQETGTRSGTEAMPAIMAFGEAARLASSEIAESMNHAAALREIVVRALAEIPKAQVLVEGAAHILSISLPGYRSEVLMNCLEDDGICLSRSSACKRGERSRILQAMGVAPDVIDGALRVSFSRDNTVEEAEYFAEKLIAISKRLFHR